MKACKNVSVRQATTNVRVTRGKEVVCMSGFGMQDYSGDLGPGHWVPCLGPFLAVEHGKDPQALTRRLS